MIVIDNILYNIIINMDQDGIQVDVGIGFCNSLVFERMSVKFIIQIVVLVVINIIKVSGKKVIDIDS